MNDPDRPTADYRHLSLWWDEVGEVTPRPSLAGDIDVDVAIVGGGFTGLWTAYYLLSIDPTLRVAVLEREVVGFGASGRNGGWCSALFAASDERIARQHGLPAALAMRHAMQHTVDEVGQVAAAEGIECGYAKGGSVTAARSPAQVARAHREIAAARTLGTAEEDLRWLDATEARSLLGAEGVLGATFTPHCAALQPALLARGLGHAIERRGAQVYERTPVIAFDAGRVHTPDATVRAEVVVRALEGYTAQLRSEHRTLVPVYSLMVATEPLPDAFWAEAGLSRRETFADHRHLIIYGQRTVDGRLAFGGRGAPYHYGSSVRSGFDHVPSVHAALATTLVELFPALAGARITHRWGGPLGVPAIGSRRWGSTATAQWPGPAATSATASRPPIWPVAPWPI